MAQDFSALVGKKVRNNGDICNAPREGIVTDLRTDRFGTSAVILWDEDEAIGWEEDGEPVMINSPVDICPAHSIKPAGTRSRFTVVG